MIEDEFGHLEHADAVFTAEDLPQLFVGLNEGFVFWVLKIVIVDVIPELLCDFCVGERLVVDDFVKLLVRLDWFQESGAWFVFGFRLCLGYKILS